MEQSDRTAMRETWDFHYKTAKVLEAAEKRAAHHKARYTWWKKELADAEKKLKDKGFEYRQQRRSLGDDLVIVGDPQLAARAAECGRKMEEHLDKRSAYESWVRALAGKAKAEPDGELVLKIEDVVYFGL